MGPARIKALENHETAAEFVFLKNAAISRAYDRIWAHGGFATKIKSKLEE